jgi:hypothetical protein
MDGAAEGAAHMLAGLYVMYAFALTITTLVGLHAAVLVGLAWPVYRRRNEAHPWGQDDVLPLQVVYGLLNPTFYLIGVAQYGATSGYGPTRPWTTFDTWLHAIAWVLLFAIWGTRLLLPVHLEASAGVRMRLRRLCVLGLVCLMAFAVNDLVKRWWAGWSNSPPGITNVLPAVAMLAMLVTIIGPLYLIPMLMLNQYRTRLATTDRAADFLLLRREVSSPLASAFAAIALVTVALSMYRPSEAAARTRVDRLRPAIEDAGVRYRVDPAILAALVYVSERDVGPFRDRLERFAATLFLFDDRGHWGFWNWGDLSIGAAQIKPMTALTALNLCRSSGQPWGFFYKHMRQLPALGREWRTGPHLLPACEPPLLPMPDEKPALVAALRDDASNVAFAALILALYESQWRDANSAWDIRNRPDILATLYQIGFSKSRPHGAPRSSDFGRRVADVSRSPWVQERFGSLSAPARSHSDRSAAR